jgi:uncharacterized protein YbjT (DUF2867 family)
MKIVVIGGTGLIGKKLATLLRDGGHEAVPASPSLGVNTLTGEGLSEVLEEADVVVDVSNSPSFEDSAVLKFFETSTANILKAATAGGLKHYVALTIVGMDRAPESGYMRAKIAQERLIKAGKIPFSFVRATQFFEFIGAIGESGAADGSIHVTHAKLQPVAANDVAATLAEISVAEPLNGMVELGGPEAIPLDELVRRYFAAKGDPRKVVRDDQAGYFGAPIDDHSLTTSENARIGAISYEQWLGQSP